MPTPCTRNIPRTPIRRRSSVRGSNRDARVHVLTFPPGTRVAQIAHQTLVLGGRGTRPRPGFLDRYRCSCLPCTGSRRLSVREDFEAAHLGHVPGGRRRSDLLSGRVFCGLCGRRTAVEQNGDAARHVPVSPSRSGLRPTSANEQRPSSFDGVGATAPRPLVDRAERRGLLQRTPNPMGGRAVDVLLSTYGMALAERLGTQVALSLSPMTGRLTRGEACRLTTLLQHLLGPG